MGSTSPHVWRQLLQAGICVSSVVREVANALVELSRSPKIAEEKRQIQDIETLTDRQCVGPVDVAKSLIGEKARRRKNLFAALQEVIQGLIRHPDRRQHATTGSVFQS
jgi:hypothetical protein